MDIPSTDRVIDDLLDRASKAFRERFGRDHEVAAYAPGRVEVLGNHTDYNEGLVLSAAINHGTVFLAARSESEACRLVAADVAETDTFAPDAPAPSADHTWANYVIGVYAGLQQELGPLGAFDGLLAGDIPLGAGLSSSAALEISASLALARLFGHSPEPLQLARIGQRAEHDFVGVKCGLLDQISSLYGEDHRLVLSDFRSLSTQTTPVAKDTCLLMCNTGVTHALVDGAYNERREHCEQAARHFASVLDHPVAALRDVTWEEWEAHQHGLDPLAARRAAHPIGENERVKKGYQHLAQGDLEAFGRLMFESHHSSMRYFENSCRELDFLVETASRIPGVLGARLSGGGFGGGAVMLLHERDAEVAAQALRSAYAKTFDHPCDVRGIVPSGGARLLNGAG